MNILGALKAAIVSDGIASTRVYQDQAPSGVAYPYAVLTDFISDTQALRGDGGQDLSRTRLIQVDVYYGTQASDDKVVMARVRRAITSAKGGTTAEGKAYRFTVPQVQRAWWHDADEVRYTATVRVTYLA